SGDFGGSVAHAAGGGGGRDGSARLSGSEDGSGGGATVGGQICRNRVRTHSAVRTDSHHCTEGKPDESVDLSQQIRLVREKDVMTARSNEVERKWPESGPDLGVLLLSVEAAMTRERTLTTLTAGDRHPYGTGCAEGWGDCNGDAAGASIGSNG